ncbi:MAG TPA: pantoate--beta-alanine ligase [Stellaceae bacterium]|nr:pantoate--beta-alanine ligase [Stellaceae bacterium]
MSAIDRPAVARTVAALRERVAGWRARRERVALVPTMGAIHDGHLALVNAGRAACDRVVASLFVNPTQFGPAEDFAAYPRDEKADLAAFGGAGVDLVFMPSVAEMYPPGFAASVQIGPIGGELEGAHRPGHFAGVATVVAKLLLQCLPEAAYFGEKDYQQLLVVRRMARDLDIPVQIEGVTTVRAADGLALSSRNAYLSPAERQTAPLLYRVLLETAAAIAGAPDRAADAVMAGINRLRAGGFVVDYLECRDAENLAPTPPPGRPARLLAAARLGRTRLIDNVPVRS